jgi:hypothetical protein
LRFTAVQCDVDHHFPTMRLDRLPVRSREHITLMAYRARFSKRDKLPTLHRATCPKAQFANSAPRQTDGLHESGDALRDLDVVTSAKAYLILDAEYPGKVRVCGCAKGSTLKLVRPTVRVG